MLELSWLLPLAILFQEGECSEKREKEKGYEEIKRGKCPEPRRKEKERREVKNGHVSDSRIRGTRYPPERKRKRKI